MRNTSITLSDHFEKFIDAKVASGHYGSASEVIRNALRMMEERDTKLQALRAALIEGEQSGEAKELDWDAFLNRMHAEAVKQ